MRLNRILGGLIGAGAALGQPGALFAQSTDVEGRWSIVPSPNGGPQAAGNTLYGVAALSPTDAWAVGTQPNQSQYLTAPLAVHWDGARWSVVSTPTIPVLKVLFNAVAAVDRNNVWAVGYSDAMNCGLCARTLIEHWDGESWSVVPSPNPGWANILNGVAAVSATDVWAVGYQWLNWSDWIPLLLHYDGTTWTPFDQSHLLTGQLFSVFALASDDVWAVGVIGLNDNFEALALHWDGTSWTRVPVPTEPGGWIVFRDISGVASNDVWAVGVYQDRNINGHVESRARAYHWDGTSWSRVLPGAYGRDSHLNKVHAVASDDVWAVGGAEGEPGSGVAFRYVTVHWDGVSWSNVENPNRGVLYDVSASSRFDAWAVGFGLDSLAFSTGTHTLHYTAGTPGPCYANCDGTTTPPVLNVSDFICFLQAFAAAEPYANCDRSTTPPVLNVNDFTCFLQRFAAGCR